MKIKKSFLFLYLIVLSLLTLLFIRTDVKADNYNGLGDDPEPDGNWYYYTNGQIDYNVNTVAQNSNGWWVIRDGAVDFGYNGIASNEFGCWYCTGGKVDFSVNDIMYTSFNGEQAWWLIRDGHVQFSDIVAQNSYGWWFVRNGKVDFTANTVANNENGWWVIRDGTVDFSYNGIANNEFGYWYCSGGKVDFSENDIMYTTVEGEWAWWLIRDGHVQFSDAVAQNSYGWWFVRNGKVDFTANTVAYNENGWWVIRNGRVDFDFTGIARNEFGYWFCSNGKVIFNYTGTVQYAGRTYNVVNGAVTDRTVLYIGDSRTVEMQNAVTEKDNEYFICRYEAYYSYFTDTAIPEFEYALEYNNIKKVVILMGVNDANVVPQGGSDHVKEYADTINALISKYPDIQFYFASVILCDRLFSEIIYPEIVNGPIMEFNAYMKENCNAIYIPVSEYVSENNIESFDGLHIYGQNIEKIYLYIRSFIGEQ